MNKETPAVQITVPAADRVQECFAFAPVDRPTATQMAKALEPADAPVNEVVGGMVQDFTRQIERLAADKVDREERIEGLQRQLNDVNGQLGQCQQRVDQSGVHVAMLEDSDKRWRVTFKNLEDDYNELSCFHNSLEDDYKELDARRANAEQAFQSITGKAADAPRAPGAAVVRLTADTVDRDERMERLQRQLDDVKEQLGQTVARLEVAVHERSNNDERWRVKYKNLEDDYNELEARRATAEQVFQSNDDRWRVKYKNLEDDYDELEARRATAEQAFRTITGKAADAPRAPGADIMMDSDEGARTFGDAPDEPPAQPKLQTMVAAGTVTGNAASSYPWQKRRGNANQELHVAKLEARREALRRFDLSLDDNTALLAEWMELIKELDVVMCLDLASSPTT